MVCIMQHIFKMAMCEWQKHHNIKRTTFIFSIYTICRRIKKSAAPQIACQYICYTQPLYFMISKNSISSRE